MLAPAHDPAAGVIAFLRGFGNEDMFNVSELEGIARQIEDAGGPRIPLCFERDLELRDDGLRLGGERVDVLYVEENLADWAKLPADSVLPQAARRGAVKLVPPLDVFLFTSKVLLAMLGDPEERAFLGPDERESNVLRENVLWSAPLDERTEPAARRMIEEGRGLVLKDSLGGGGDGVDVLRPDADRAQPSMSCAVAWSRAATVVQSYFAPGCWAEGSELRTDLRLLVSASEGEVADRPHLRPHPARRQADAERARLRPLPGLRCRLKGGLDALLCLSGGGSLPLCSCSPALSLSKGLALPFGPSPPSRYNGLRGASLGRDDKGVAPVDPTDGVVILSRLQFAFTIGFHILWPVLTIGLSSYLVLMEALYLKTGREVYYRQARFWGRLFLLGFGLGVATGVVMAFQFGTNWAEFSRVSGDFFGNVLGFEATMAFAAEAAFLAIMMFGWNRVPRSVHMLATCVVAGAATLSAFWIMDASSWMQTPAGVSIQDGVDHGRQLRARRLQPRPPGLVPPHVGRLPGDGPLLRGRHQRVVPAEGARGGALPEVLPHGRWRC